MTKDQIEELAYLKAQVLVLAWFAARDTADSMEVAKIQAAAIEVSAAPVGDDFEKAKEQHFETLHHLSSLVDKTKSGGWIADRSAVYRVEFYGREYRNTDLIQISMVDRDHNSAEGLFKRARDVARALNAAHETPVILNRNPDLSRGKSVETKRIKIND
jgi:hypothetical protein